MHVLNTIDAPWRAELTGENAYGDAYTVYDSRGSEIADCLTKEIATFMVASTELFAACEALVSQYDAPGGPAITEQVNALRAAIAHARSEQVTT